MVGYGTLSLLVNRVATRGASRVDYCWAMPCFDTTADSPSSIGFAPHRSVEDAKAALVLEPASAYRWADLAEAELNANDVEKAMYSFRRALAAGPGNPAILFRAAAFYLRLEDYPKTLSKLTSILRNPDLSEYYSKVFSIYRQMDLPLAEILNQDIPHNETAAAGFLSFWIEGHQLDEARETWAWLMQNSLADADAAAEYVGFLVKNKTYSEALQTWAGFNSASDPGYQKMNWIFNGSFEREPADCPFDWNVDSTDVVDVSIESGTNYGGTSALKLAFIGQRKTEFRPIFQEAVLTPGWWTLRAYMKASQPAGDQGLFFHIVDAESAPRLDVSTSAFDGSLFWTAVEASFLVPPATKLVRVELLIPKAASVNSDFSGSVWVDHVELIPGR